MSNYLTPEDIGKLPPGLRMKIQQLTPTQMENIKSRVRARMNHRDQKRRRLDEAAANRKAREIVQDAPPTEIFDRFEYSMPYAPNVEPPPRRYKVSPRYEGELVDIPIDVAEGAKAELVETYGFDEDSAAVIAGNAIDRWVEMGKPGVAKMTNEQATKVEEDFVPKFLIHPLGDPAQFSGFGQLPDSPTAIAPAPVPVPVVVNQGPTTSAVVEAYKDAGWKKVVPLFIVGGLLFLAARRK